jgi:hypothetical protein
VKIWKQPLVVIHCPLVRIHWLHQTLILILCVSFLFIGRPQLLHPCFPFSFTSVLCDLVSGTRASSTSRSAAVFSSWSFKCAGTWMKSSATRGCSSNRRRRCRCAARPCCSVARRLCSTAQPPRASTTHSEYVAQLVAFVSPWRGRVLVVVSSLVSVLGCVGAQGSEVPVQRGGGLL